MGYQAALTANQLARIEYEAEALAVSAIVISCTDNEFMSASLVRQAAMSLRNADVRPQSDGMFVGVISGPGLRSVERQHSGRRDRHPQVSP